MKSLSVVILFVLLGVKAQAQQQDSLSSISGTVFSSINGLPVEESIVDIKWTKYLTSTDSLGAFSINDLPPKEYHLRIVGFGYTEIDTSVILEPGKQSNLEFVLHGSCPFDAKTDIEKGFPKLLLIGSIAPVYYPDQDEFEKEFRLKYYDFGDMPPADACVSEYNKTIFKYLDTKFGNEWRKEVRKDVVYLNE